MSDYSFENGFVPDLNQTDRQLFEGWLEDFPVARTRNFQQILSRQGIEASRFTEVTPIVPLLNNPEVQEVAKFFYAYSAYLPVKDLAVGKEIVIPFMHLTTRSGIASNALAIPMTLVEIHGLENAHGELPLVSIADLTHTRLSVQMNREQIQSVIQLYTHKRLYRQITVHFLGGGFINNMLSVMGRVAENTRPILDKVLVVNNMDQALGKLVEIVGTMVRAQPSN